MCGLSVGDNRGGSNCGCSVGVYRYVALSWKLWMHLLEEQSKPLYCLEERFDRVEYSDTPVECRDGTMDRMGREVPSVYIQAIAASGNSSIVAAVTA